MFMASIAGVAPEVVALVAGGAGHVVIGVEDKGLVMGECRRFPGSRDVARGAASIDLAVQAVAGRLVASLAASQLGLGQKRVIERGWFPAVLAMASSTRNTKVTVQIVLRCGVARRATIACHRPQQGMREPLVASRRLLRPDMVDVADHAVTFEKLLVKRCLDTHPWQRNPLGRAQSDVRHVMTSDATHGRRAAPRRMARETVRPQVAMSVPEHPGADHQVRVGERQHHDGQQVGRDQPEGPAARHFHPQKRKIAMMCARASTANARVIG